MLIFANPSYLWLLLLVPAILVAYGITMASARRRVREFGDEDLVSSLMPHRSAAKGWVRTVLAALAVAFVVTGLARPQIGAKLSKKQSRGVEVMICLDVSNSMLAQDYSPSRMGRAKLAISSLVDRLQGDRVGLIIFAGTSFVQLPITTDYVSAKMFLSSIDAGSIPVQGTAIGDAIRTAARSFSAQSENSRAIILITDGENHEDDAAAAAKDAAEAGIKIYTIGVGSAEGRPIPMPDGTLMKDSKDEIVVSRLDEQTLRDVARLGGGAYIHAGNEEFGLNPVIDDIRAMQDEEFSSVVFEEYDEQFMYFLAMAFLLLLVEVLVGERKTGKKLFR